MNKSKILPGVPAMRYGNPSAVCYIGSVMRLMEYIGDPVAQDELFALSGAGLCFPWRFASCCDEVSIIPEIPARTFEALGYESEYYYGDNAERGAHAKPQKEFYLDKIKQSIDADRPVIGFGITEKMPMSCLIVGYDEGGLYTRSFWPPNGAKHDSEEYYYNSDWYEKCAGLLIIGKKTGERLTGQAAYDRIVDWAVRFRNYDHLVIAEGQEIFTNRRAFDEMVKWLLDDEQWQNPKNNEQFLKQCGLLLFNHYRWQLYEYLKKLNAEYPGVVNPPVFAAIERIAKAIPGAHTSDLWLHEAVDPALCDFTALRGRGMREKATDYVNLLKEYDNSLQWTLFMPGVVKNIHGAKPIKRESFEYRDLGKLRFIGIDAWRTGEDWGDLWARSGEFMPALDALASEYGVEISENCSMMHHNGHEVDTENHYLAGRFFKTGTPVPQGCDYYDVPTVRAAYAVYSSDNFNGDIWQAYDFTRDQILGDGVSIPYPKAYWHAEVYTDGRPREGSCRFAYMFSVGEWQTVPIDQSRGII